MTPVTVLFRALVPVQRNDEDVGRKSEPAVLKDGMANIHAMCWGSSEAEVLEVIESEPHLGRLLDLAVSSAGERGSSPLV